MATMLVAIGEFRQHATKFIRQVEETGQQLTVTRRGVPVVVVQPAPRDPLTLAGSVTYIGDVDLTRPVIDPEAWEANR